MKSITVNTVQGIGDIFWVYQKLAPYVNEIHWRICRVGDDPVQFRSKEFVTLLPKTASVKFPLVTNDQYRALAASRFALADVLKHEAVNYAVNNPLEHGADLYTMDPGYIVAESVELQTGLAPKREDYLCVFIAGSNAEFVWSVETWAERIRDMAHAMGIGEIAVIGAEWDLQHSRQLTIYLQRDGFKVHNFCNCLTLDATITVIRSAKYFFGYQSGLNVIADNYDVPQLMIYFPFLHNMLYTWAKPKNRRTTFRATTFDDPNINTVIKQCSAGTII